MSELSACQTTSSHLVPSETPGTAKGDRRWWILSAVVAAQFMFGVDAFIVNVAIPTIAQDLQASAAEIESVVAIYLIAYGTLVVTGGRLGDIFGTRDVFLIGVAGFVLTSLWCGLARSGPELIAARTAQGASAALMVPQVLATLHVLFSDEARSRAFAIYGVVLGLAGAAGFLLGGLLVSLDPAGLGWRSVFFVNVPCGIAIIVAAWRLMPPARRQTKTRLDLPGALLLFLGLLFIIGPLLFGRELNWSITVWATMAVGLVVIALFMRFERGVARRGGMPLIDLALVDDRAFLRGLCAVFCFFFANLSFYFIMTLFMQTTLHYGALFSGLAVVPLALAFVVASRHSAARARHRGMLVLIEGCALQIVSLAALALAIAWLREPLPWALMSLLAVFGYGQGLVMAPLSSAVLSTVKSASAGAGSGLYGTTTQIANAAGVAAVGAVFFAVRDTVSDHAALLAAFAIFGAAIALCAAFLMWMRRA